MKDEILMVKFVKTIGDKTYILIGNEEQLRKIGSDETVYGQFIKFIYMLPIGM